MPRKQMRGESRQHRIPNDTLTFNRKSDLDKAIKILKKAGYTTEVQESIQPSVSYGYGLKKSPKNITYYLFTDAPYEETIKLIPRKNPSDGFEEATEVSEGFHGRKSLYVEDIIEIERYRTKLAHLGDLVELEILDDSGKHVIPIGFPIHDSEEHVSVASTPDRNQLIFSGGNQGIELESFPDLSDAEKLKDYVRIGEVFSISYFTDKHHLEGPKYQKDGTEYIHQFGEEDGGVRPELMYDSLNQRMILVGGSYEVRDEGIYN